MASEHPAVKDHEHDLRKEHVGPPRQDAFGNVTVVVWVACTDHDCAGYWTGEAELSLDEESVEEMAKTFEIEPEGSDAE